MTNCPAISVIVPMYNAEKFIGECLESLLAQTFFDFEVIVVDDCSTDSSRAIVERYVPKFGGRLKLLRMEKNSGRPSLPRNKGLLISRGEYVFFMDNDDLLIETALAELHALAKNYDADVVYCEKYFAARDDLSEIFIESEQQKDFVRTPTFESDNFAVRVEKFLAKKFLPMPWTKLVKRDLIIEHEIFFPHVAIAEDDIWTYAVIFNAKKILRISNVVYVWRQNENSIFGRRKTPQETINFWLNPIVTALKTLDEHLDRVEFFRRNMQYRCAVLESFVHLKTAQLFDAVYDLSLPEIYAAIKNEFGASLDKHDVLISWLLTDLIIQQKTFFLMQHKINELEARQ